MFAAGREPVDGVRCGVDVATGGRYGTMSSFPAPPWGARNPRSVEGLRIWPRTDVPLQIIVWNEGPAVVFGVTAKQCLGGHSRPNSTIGTSSVSRCRNEPLFRPDPRVATNRFFRLRPSGPPLATQRRPIGGLPLSRENRLRGSTRGVPGTAIVRSELRAGWSMGHNYVPGTSR